MNTKNIQGECQHCGGHFEFPAEAAGVVGECPHCGQQTECLLATPPEESSPIRGKVTVFAVIAALILVGGWIGIQMALKRAERLAEKKSPPPVAEPANPFAADNFRASTVTLESTSGSKLVHAHGTVVNLANRQRFGVKVELELLDASGKPIGKASDYTGVVEANAEWKFRAPVIATKAASAKIVSIKETK